MSLSQSEVQPGMHIKFQDNQSYLDALKKKPKGDKCRICEVSMNKFTKLITLFPKSSFVFWLFENSVSYIRQTNLKFTMRLSVALKLPSNSSASQEIELQTCIYPEIFF